MANKCRKMLIISDSSYEPIKMYLDQMSKLAKGLIRIGHDVRHLSYCGILSELSPFKSRTLSCFFMKAKAKADEIIGRVAKHYQPDIVFVGFARLLDIATLTMLREVVPSAVFVGRDGDPWPSRKAGRIETACGLDILLATNNGYFLDEYRRAGVKRCTFMPNMCNPDQDHRYSVDESRKSDILWTGKLSHHKGNNDMLREDVVKEIAKLPNAKIYGCLGRPQIEGIDYLYAISGARLGIHINAVNDVSMYHSGRLTHYLACGTCVLSKRVPNSERLFKDKQHLIYYDTVDQLMDLIAYYLNNEDQRQKIADHGMEWVHKEYSCQKIAQYVLEVIENGTYKAAWT